MRKSAMAVALIVFLAPAAALPQAKSGKSGVYEQLNLFGEAFERIRHDAVESVADSKLIETAIAGMLAGLGPHSVYLNETEYKALQTRTSSETGRLARGNGGHQAGRHHLHDRQGADLRFDPARYRAEAGRPGR